MFFSCPPYTRTNCGYLIKNLRFVHLLSTRDQMKPDEAVFLEMMINESHHHKTAPEQRSEGAVRVF